MQLTALHTGGDRQIRLVQTPIRRGNVGRPITSDLFEGGAAMAGGSHDGRGLYCGDHARNSFRQSALGAMSEL